MEGLSDSRDNLSASSHPSAMTDGSTAPSQGREVAARKKTSTACSVCKKRKTRCSGEYPCDRCIQRGTIADCVIDSNADLRRRGASERRTEELEIDRRLLDGLLQTIKSGSEEQVQSLFSMIRDNSSKPDLLAHVETHNAGCVTSEGSVAESEQPYSPRDDRRRESHDLQQRPRGKIHDLLNHGP